MKERTVEQQKQAIGSFCHSIGVVGEGQKVKSVMIAQEKPFSEETIIIIIIGDKKTKV